MRIYPVLLLFIIVLGSCDSTRVYEASTDIDDAGWRETQVLEFKFEVPDANQSYNILYTVRYSNNYPNYNLYVKNFLSDSSGRLILEKLQGMDLFKPTTGAPFGSGLGGNLDYSILGLSDYKFPHKGWFNIRIKQYMRQDPLKGIAAFGIRLEKHTSK